LWSRLGVCDPVVVRKSLYSTGQQKIAMTVREMRRQAGLTQRGLARRLRRPLNVVSRIETGQRRVDLLEWIALCEACETDAVESGRRLLGQLVSRK
jgi:transcriptional regulator with XRE-family HTH domain